MTVWSNALYYWHCDVISLYTDNKTGDDVSRSSRDNVQCQSEKQRYSGNINTQVPFPFL